MKLSKRAAEASARETASKRRELLKMFAGLGAVGAIGSAAYAGSERILSPARLRPRSRRRARE